jgi:SulP family sulfate permease
MSVTQARRDGSWQSGDFSGGLAAAAVLLPQAMAFGVALYAPAGVAAADGAYAGLLGTALLCLASGLFGGTSGLISSPTGPTLVLLGGALVALIDAGLGGGALFLALAAITVLTGVFQLLIGVSGGGRLIKYIPYPVVSGFMLGSALLMINSQRATIAGNDAIAGWTQWWWLPAAAAFLTIACAVGAGRLLAWLPGPVAGLFAGTVAFHLVAALRGVPLPDIWMIGALPGMRAPSFDLAALSATLPWNIIVPAALALSVLSSLDTLLTAVVADVTTGARHDAGRELVGQGFGQIASGICGGMAGAGTTAATVVAAKSGGRRWAEFATAICFIVLLSVGGWVGTLLPVPVLAGIICYVASGMVDRDLFRWVSDRRTRVDAGIAVLVAMITVFYDLMIAVGVGIGIAIVLFIRSEIKSPVVHRRSTGRQIRSTRNRNERESALLDEHGDRIVFFELRGNLFFATADRLFEEMLDDLDEPKWLIVHLRRVGQIDLTAIRFFHQTASRLAAHGGQLLFCNVHQRFGIGADMSATLKRIAAAGGTNVLTFNGKDEALEFAEDALLRDLDCEPTRIDDAVTLEDSDICGRLDPEDVRILRSAVVERSLERDETLFVAGESGAEMYIVVRGEVDIRLPTTSHHHKRLASCGPGSFFGELSMLKPGPRAAHAVAMRRTELLVLDGNGLAQLQTAHPATAARLLRALCEIEVARLRWSSIELQRLSES